MDRWVLGRREKAWYKTFEKNRKWLSCLEVTRAAGQSSQRAVAERIHVFGIEPISSITK